MTKKSKYASKMKGGGSGKNTKYSSKMRGGKNTMKKTKMTPTFNEVIKKKVGGRV